MQRTLTYLLNRIINKSNDSGLSLIEVLAALLIVSLVAASILSLFKQGLTWNRGAALRTQSIAYAQSVIEELKVHPDHIRVNPGGSAAAVGVEAETPPGVESHIYISYYDRSLMLYLIEIDLSWSIKGKVQHERLAAVLRGAE